MLNSSVFRRRRERLAQRIPEGVVVLGGHRQLPINLPMNLSPKRQGSHILYLTGLHVTDSAILFCPETGRLEMFGPAADPDDEIWHGPKPSFADVAENLGADAAYPLSELEARVEYFLGRLGGTLHTLPSADPDWQTRMKGLGTELPPFGALPRTADVPLADALIALRSIHGPEEIEEMRTAGALTAEAFKVAMAATQVGGTEAQLRGLIEGIYRAAGVRTSYDPIVTVRGEVLHCESNPYRLESNDLLLVDSGCESPNGYAADVTRTWPTRGTFDARQRAIYEIVLEAELQCIERIQVGTEYQSVHLHAAAVIAEGLKDLGILRGSVSDLVDNDAHALFFPHGVGHLIGLDVHDIEDFGDRAGYAPGRERSARFGLAALRLNRRLEADMAVTIEPGIYFIPGLLNRPEIREQYRQWVDFERASSFLGFGGIRIEDDILVTDDGPEVLTPGIPRTIEEVEAITGSSPDLLGAIARFQPITGE